MYKVFIDNKVIVFTENLKKSNKNKDFILINTSFPDAVDLVKCRNELPNGVTLIVQAENPEEAIMHAFRDYDFIQAAGGIVKRKKKYLFIERHGLWDLPKGKMEALEEPSFTAVREIEEECGIYDPRIERLIGITFHTYDYKGVPTLKKNWWYALSYDGPKKLVPQAEESITKAKWLRKRKWGKVKAKTYASIVEVLELYEKQKAFGEG